MEVTSCIFQLRTVRHRQDSGDVLGKIKGLVYIQKVYVCLWGGVCFTWVSTQVFTLIYW